MTHIYSTHTLTHKMSLDFHLRPQTSWPSQSTRTDDGVMRDLLSTMSHLYLADTPWLFMEKSQVHHHGCKSQHKSKQNINKPSVYHTYSKHAYEDTHMNSSKDQKTNKLRSCIASFTQLPCSEMLKRYLLIIISLYYVSSCKRQLPLASQNQSHRRGKR